MPPKAMLHKDKGKLKSLSKPKPVQNTGSQDDQEPSTSDADIQRQFEVELCWCIQQLQIALGSGKLNPKQIQENSKTLNTLMSNSAPLIKKRQLMRLSFGDYRAKMAADDKKFNKINNQMKLTPAKPSAKSVFVKKAPFLSSDSNFKFNFNVSPEDQAIKDISKLNLENKESDKVQTSDYRFQPSNNEFRFNFIEASGE